MSIWRNEGHVITTFGTRDPAFWIKVPYKAIAYAVLLFVVGTVLIVIGSLMHAGVYFAKDTERSVPMICVGSLAFIPGSYITFTAYKAWKKEPGWSFDDIPSAMDDE